MAVTTVAPWHAVATDSLISPSNGQNPHLTVELV